MIYQSSHTLLKYISGIPYLVPLAQNICERRPLLRLNDTGVIIWNHIGEGTSFPDLIASLMRYYELEPEQSEELTADVKAFISSLKAVCAVIETDYPETKDPALTFETSDLSPDTDYSTLKAAGLSLKLYLPMEYIHDDLKSFLTEKDSQKNLDITESDGKTQLVMLVTEPVTLPYKLTPVINDPLLILYKYENGYLYHHPENDGVTDMFVTDDGTKCTMFLSDENAPKLSEEIFFALRESFLFLASKHHMYCLHSASIDCSGKTLLFSGPSGMGKSTHTGLWVKYRAAEYINGDLNLLAIKDQKPVIKGIPWCGTSGICDNKTHEVSAVFLLEKGIENRIIPQTADQLITGVFMRITSPRFDRAMTSDIIDFAENYCSLIKVNRISCDISEAAVRTAEQCL